LRAARVASALISLGDAEVTIAVSGDGSAARLVEGCGARIVPVEGVPARMGKPVFDPRSLPPMASDRRYDVVVVDMLDTDDGVLSATRRRSEVVFTLDDRGPGRMDADAIVNVLVREPDRAALPNRVRLFEGPAFATLDPAYMAPLPTRAMRERAGRTLVTLGGADAEGLMLRACHALRGASGLDHVQFVCGPASPHREALEQAVVGSAWSSEVLSHTPTLRPLLLDCDVAIVAGGLTMHEACATGTPAIAYCQAVDHQAELAGWLAGCGAIRTLGYGGGCSARDLCDAVATLAGDAPARQRMSDAGRALVDGRGTERVARAINDAIASAGKE
jgi:spore coat polysaccharide biosynthesis predicted glycosyltransferase SpsG